MKIGFYHLNDMAAETKARLLRRAEADIADVTAKVLPIIKDVRKHGDKALIKYAKKLDGAVVDHLKVSSDEFLEARQTLGHEVKGAIDHCADNVRRFHEEQLRRAEKRWMVETEPHIWCGEQISPISSVGLYVPGGKNLFPSVVYMLGIPAVIAGVPQVAMVTPPGRDGKIGNALLYAAEVAGIQHVYKAGGAQAIAALAYGTETIPAVKKVLGPGNPYVAAAKQVLSTQFDPGMPAGPSESIILCDASANPHNTVLDLLNEAEHGPDSAALLITHDEALAHYVRDHLPAAIDALPEPQRSYCKAVMADYGGIIVTQNLEESIAFANEYAVEHLLLKVENPQDLLSRLTNAGEIIIGENTPIAAANYGTGVNHVLPTGGRAHSYSCTSIWDFLKRTSLTMAHPKGLENLKDSVEILADYEGLTAHGNALRQRQTENIIAHDVDTLVA